MTDNAANDKTQREMLMDLTVSAAVQESQLNTVIDTLDKHCASEEKWRAGYDERLRTVETGQKEQAVELKHTIRNATWFNGIYASITAIAAGVFGAKS